MLNLTITEDDPRVIELLEQIVRSQSTEVRRDYLERLRDMSAESELRALAEQTNDFTNRLAASAAGIASDLAALKAIIETGTVTAEALALVTGATANVGAMAASLEAIDSGFPVPTPTPVPAPEEPVVVPPAEDAPGTEPIPTDDGAGGGGV